MISTKGNWLTLCKYMEVESQNMSIYSLQIDTKIPRKNIFAMNRIHIEPFILLAANQFELF